MSEPKQTIILDQSGTPFQQLAVVEKETAVAPTDEAINILAVIARAAADPNVDVAKMQALLEMQKEIRAEQAKIAFNEAMARLQTKLPRISKKGEILNKNGTVRSRYAPLDDIDAVVRPLLAEEGFSVAYTTVWNAGYLNVICTIKHVMGHQEASPFAVPFDKNDFRSGAQDMSSTNSFGKRISLCNALNIITIDDNDGQNNALPIDAPQLAELNKLISLTKADLVRFCKFMGVEAVKDITKADYSKAINALKTKAGN